MKLRLSLITLVLLFTISACTFSVDTDLKSSESKAPELMPSLLESEGVWSDLAGELEEVSFLEHYPSYKLEGRSYYYKAYVKEESKTAQAWMEGIEEISLKDGKEEKSEIVRVEAGHKITDYGLFDEFLVWLDLSADGTWILKAKNLETDELLVLDKSLASSLSKSNVLPNDFGYSEGILGYRCSLEGQKQVGIKIYDFYHKTLDILAQSDDEKGKWFYSPSVAKDYVAWSLSTQGKEGEEYGKVFIYSKVSKETKCLETKENLITPVVYGDYLVVREKPKGQNFIYTDKGYVGASLWCYDLKKDKWLFSLSNQLKPYQGKNIATLHTPKAFYQNLFVYDLEPKTEPLVIVDMAKTCYYVVPKDKVSGKTYQFLKFEDGFIYLSLKDKVYRAKLKV